jgi:hypothetical protein
MSRRVHAYRVEENVMEIRTYDGTNVGDVIAAVDLTRAKTISWQCDGLEPTVRRLAGVFSFSMCNISGKKMIVQLDDGTMRSIPETTEADVSVVNDVLRVFTNNKAN